MNAKEKITFISVIILSALFFAVGVHAQAPYSITAEPEKTSAAPGDLKEYTITINAEPGFEDSIYLEVEITALTYNELYMIDVVDPPYPVEYNYVFEVPEDVPADVTATGIIRGISGDYVVEEEVTIDIKTGGLVGAIVGWILKILNAIRNFFS